MKEQIRDLSLELRAIQAPVRILPRVVWDRSLEPRFHRGHTIHIHVKKMYTERELRFNPDAKLRELDVFEKKLIQQLGKETDVAKILRSRVSEYRHVVCLLRSVGTPEFGACSRELWGSSRDKLFSDGTTVAQYARTLQRLIKTLLTPEQNLAEQRVIPAAAVIELMKARFREVHLLEHIELVLSDDITANASAGNGRIKIRRDALFSTKDVQVLIYHEAFTHLATSTNGHAQPYAKWLGFDSPGCTSTQEGLAVLMEIFSNSTYPQRILKIADRVIAVNMAEEGAGVNEVHEYLVANGYGEAEAYQLMSRAFRGTDPSSGQAFTKDVAYLKGLIECYNFIQFCLVRNHADFLPLLFAGKLKISEMPELVRAYRERVVIRPKWIPAPFQDIDALSSWFICTAALGRMGDEGYHSRFQAAFEET